MREIRGGRGGTGRTVRCSATPGTQGAGRRYFHEPAVSMTSRVTVCQATSGRATRPIPSPAIRLDHNPSRCCSARPESPRPAAARPRSVEEVAVTRRLSSINPVSHVAMRPHRWLPNAIEPMLPSIRSHAPFVACRVEIGGAICRMPEYPGRKSPAFLMQDPRSMYQVRNVHRLFRYESRWTRAWSRSATYRTHARHRGHRGASLRQRDLDCNRHAMAQPENEPAHRSAVDTVRPRRRQRVDDRGCRLRSSSPAFSWVVPVQWRCPPNSPSNPMTIR